MHKKKVDKFEDEVEDLLKFSKEVKKLNNIILEASLRKEKQRALDECWQYHKGLMKEENPKLTKDKLEDFLYDVDLTDWEDIGFFVGYLKGIDDTITISQKV
jgi:hypothetical protein